MSTVIKFQSYIFLSNPKLSKLQLHNSLSLRRTYINISEQRGFRLGKSTNTGSVIFMTYISENLDALPGRCDDVVIRDVKKAFDTVIHDSLMEELNHLDVTPSGCTLVY